MEKICKTCEVEKPLYCFSTRKISRDGFRKSCKLFEYQKQQKHYNDNLEALERKIILGKEWRNKNVIRLKENIDNFHLKNPEYRKNYQLNNRDKINIRNKNRRDTDMLFKISENIRTLIKNSLNYKKIKKKSKSFIILGCDSIMFKDYIESKWEPWMNWDNYGNPKDGILELNKTWDLDHIIAISTAITEEDVIRLNHYTNFQPLCSYTNRIIKRAKTFNPKTNLYE